MRISHPKKQRTELIDQDHAISSSTSMYLAAAPDYAKVLEPQAGDPNLTRTLVIIFDALNLFSAITLSTVLLIAWFSIRIRRVSTWYLYIFSWDIYSLGYLLILGYQAGGTMPVKGLCLFQSAMIYATPVFTAASVVIFVIQIYLDLESVLGLKPVDLDYVKKLILIPWMFFLTIICEVVIIGLTSPDSVERNPSGMFCHLTVPFSSQVTGVIVILCIIFMMGFGALITVTIRQNRGRWQTLLENSECHSVDLLFRVSTFLLAPIIAIGLVLLEFLPARYHVDMAAVNVVYAILPAMAGIISASQKDIRNVYLFWWSSNHQIMDSEGAWGTIRWTFLRRTCGESVMKSLHDKLTAK